ncbi:MAG TPA: mechanosensitive ion channel family protein [Gaiellales bacterium]|nr:mechanosensitive ion channel family protein [Gaiellales bacterium]
MLLVTTPISKPTWESIALIVGVFALAWIVSRGSGRVAERIVKHSETRHLASGDRFDTGMIASLKRRETAISLVQTTVRYAAYLLALVFALGAISFGTRIGPVAGASLIVLLVGFAGQRFLTDIMAGFFMFFEGWYSVGDNVTIEPLGLRGIVDEVGLRATRLRTVGGEIVRVHNSQILATRVQPRGAREVEIEFFVTDQQAGRSLVEEVARIVPSGPTRFVRPPWVEEVEPLDEDLIRIRARATVAHGREWLAETFLPDLIKERGEHTVVHGPVVWHVDEIATRRFARTLGLPQAPPDR